MRKRVILSLASGAVAVMLISFIILTPIFFITFEASAINEINSEMQDNINHIKPLAKMSLSFRTRKMDRLFNESMHSVIVALRSSVSVASVASFVLSPVEVYVFDLS